MAVSPPTPSSQPAPHRDHRPLRRATDPTMLLGPARPLSAAAAASVGLGAGLAALGSSTYAVAAFVLCTVMGVGLLASARRTDTATRHDLAPDESPRTRGVIVVILVLAVVGGGWAAWLMTETWSDLGPRSGATGTTDDVWHGVSAGFLTLAGLVLPVLAVWILDWAMARIRPGRNTIAADLDVAVWTDGTLHRASTSTALLIGDDLFEPAELPRARHFEWRGLAFDVHNPPSPLRPPIAVVASPDGLTAASRGTLAIDGTTAGRVGMSLRDTWIFVLDAARTGAATDPAAPDFHAAYGRLVLLRSRASADPVDLSDLPRLAHELARASRGSGLEAGTVKEMLEFVDANVSAPRDLPRLRRRDPEPALPQATVPSSFLDEFTDPDDEPGQL